VAKKFSARRYAQAVFDVALEKNKLNEWLIELEAISQLNQDKTVAAYLENPAVSFKDKTGILSGKLPGIDIVIVNMIYLLLANGRIDKLTGVVSEYKRMLDVYNGIERAEVITAVPLDNVSRQNLDARLGELIGKKVLIESERVDPGLIGGVVVKVGGKMLDGSTRSALNALKKEIS
jgi:F-type H+-transporting ATPase subunit delta